MAECMATNQIIPLLQGIDFINRVGNSLLLLNAALIEFIVTFQKNLNLFFSRKSHSIKDNSLTIQSEANCIKIIALQNLTLYLFEKNIKFNTIGA